MESGFSRAISFLIHLLLLTLSDLRDRLRGNLIAPPGRGNEPPATGIMDHWAISLVLLAVVAFTAMSASELMSMEDDNVGHLFDLDAHSDGE